MAAIANVYLKVETLETLVSVLKKKQEKGVSLTILINDEIDKYGQNVSSFVSQTREDREAKKPKFYTGNGKVVWVNGSVKVAEKSTQQSTSAVTPSISQSDDDLPF